MKNKNENKKKQYLIKDNKSIKQALNCKVVTDPNGSYTGVPVEKLEKPVQDVDDL